jgi:hypothetical protein
VRGHATRPTGIHIPHDVELMEMQRDEERRKEGRTNRDHKDRERGLTFCPFTLLAFLYVVHLLLSPLVAFLFSHPGMWGSTTRRGARRHYHLCPLIPSSRRASSRTTSAIVGTRCSQHRLSSSAHCCCCRPSLTLCIAAHPRFLLPSPQLFS